jgi:predicted DNA-binding ribbon-helix-helix protein
MQRLVAASFALPENQKATRHTRSTLVSRNVTVSGHRTSVRLEPDMWSGLTEICRRERASLHEVCTMISGHKDGETSLTAAIRVYIMSYFRSAATEDGHSRALHGYGSFVA